MFGLEGTHLQLEDEISVQADMVEEQIDVEGSPVHNDWELTAHKGKPFAEFQNQITQMRDEWDRELPASKRH